jgi:hypothetical protein
MSDELERRLRDAGHHISGPTDLETHVARTRVLAARARRTRRLMWALVAAVLVGCAFGVGYAVAASGQSSPKSKYLIRRVPAHLNLGPGFLPSPVWTVVGSATAATATSERMATRISARFAPASTRPGLPRRLLPLQLPLGGRKRHVQAHVGAYAVDVTVTFGVDPTPTMLASAREELGNLVVPSCPAALPLQKPEAGAAAGFVRVWLPAHYPGQPSDVLGAVSKGHAGQAMPRYGEAAADCGRLVASRSVEVDVTLPRVAKASASLSELTYFVARTAQGFIVWERAR